jgi:hypothetical protein
MEGSTFTMYKWTILAAFLLLLRAPQGLALEGQSQNAAPPAIKSPASPRPLIHQVIHQYDVLIETLAKGMRDHWSQAQFHIALKNATVCTLPVERLLQTTQPWDEKPRFQAQISQAIRQCRQERAVFLSATAHSVVKE